jgi:biofilm PGA synthesis N-glycosyltransferase PgaC
VQTEIVDLLRWIDHTPIYRAMLYFYGFYPVLMSLLWMVLSLFFRLRQEDKSEYLKSGPYPFVSIILPAYAEEHAIGHTLEALCNLDYPEYEIIVVNDASPDRTAEIVRKYMDRGPIRLVD